MFQDCAEIQRFGANVSGIYTIHVANMTEPRKVRGPPGGGGYLRVLNRGRPWQATPHQLPALSNI